MALRDLHCIDRAKALRPHIPRASVRSGTRLPVILSAAKDLLLLVRRTTVGGAHSFRRRDFALSSLVADTLNSGSSPNTGKREWGWQAACVQGRDQILAMHMIQVGPFCRQSGVMPWAFRTRIPGMEESHLPGVQHVTGVAMSLLGMEVHGFGERADDNSRGRIAREGISRSFRPRARFDRMVHPLRRDALPHPRNPRDPFS